MRSLYKRQLTMMVGVMVLSFTLLSTAFMLLSYRYIISENLCHRWGPPLRL